MDNVISFTPAELIGLILGVCGFLAAVSGASAIISKAVARVKAPNAEQDKKIKNHEDRLNAHDAKFTAYDTYFKNDKIRIEAIENGNKVTQQALLALLSHALDGNSIVPLKKAKESLEEYLINRK